MNIKSQIQSDQSQWEAGEGLPANNKLAQATYAPAAQTQLLLPEHNRPFLFHVLLRCPDCAPRTDGGACSLVVCGQLTSQLVLAHLSLLLQAFKVLHPRSLEDQDYGSKCRERCSKMNGGQSGMCRDNRGNNVDRRRNESKPHDWRLLQHTHCNYFL